MAKIESNVKTLLESITNVATSTAMNNLGQFHRENYSDHESESDSDDENKVRVYDASPKMIKMVLRSARIGGVSSPEDHRGQSAPHLIDKIRQVLETTGLPIHSNGNFSIDATFGLASYLLVIDCLHELFVSHGRYIDTRDRITVYNRFSRTFDCRHGD